MKTKQTTIFNTNKEKIITDFLKQYPQIELLKTKKILERETIRNYLIENKKRDLKIHNTRMYKEGDKYINAQMLMNNNISIRKFKKINNFLLEYRKTSLNRANQYPGMKPYQILCDNVPIGLICLGVPLFTIKKRDMIIGKENRQKGHNIQCCVSYPWASRFLTGKLLASISCAIGYQDNKKFIETTSLFGKSIQYDRLPFLRFITLTNGKGRLGGVFPPDFYTKGKYLLQRLISQKELKLSKQSDSKKTIMDALIKNSYYSKEYKVSNVSVKRGYYLCCIDKNFSNYKKKWEPPHSVDEAIEYWRKRWLVKRL